MKISKLTALQMAVFFAITFFSFANISTPLQTNTNPPEALSDFWNTGCYYIANSTSDEIFILDGEDQGYKLNIDVKDIKNFNGVLFPWVSNSDEIVKKAFRFYSGKDTNGSFMFYLFQNFHDNKIYYSKSGEWGDKVLCSFKEKGRLNVLISCDNTPTCEAYN